MNDLVIGPSTGWLYGIDIYSLADHTHFLRSASSRANAIELPMTGLSCDDKRYSSLAEGKSLNEKEWLVYKSIHLPDYSIEASEVGNIKWLIERHGFNTTLCHPLKQKSEYPVESYELLIDSGIPLSIENMDLNKDSGYDIDELAYLVENYGLGFVLDVQHACGRGMVYARELFDALSDQIVHLHVSGEDKDNRLHSLVYLADNRGVIMNFLIEVFSQIKKPIILEGECIVLSALAKEINYIATKLLVVD